MRKTISDKTSIGCVNIITGTEKVPNLSTTASARFLEREKRVNKRAILRASGHLKADKIQDVVGYHKL